MPKFSFADLEAAQEKRTERANGSAQRQYVSYFALKNDGDEAVVRFVYKTTEDFELNALHKYKAGDFFRNVNCLRSYGEPMDKCPFCASEDETLRKVYTKFFVKMVEYVKAEDGTITVKPVMWEKPTAFARTLAGYINEYGPLDSFCCKIRRHGAKGSRDTTYEIIPLVSPNQMRMYDEESYPKDFSGFDSFKLSPFFVADRSADEMKEFLSTGEFPAPVKKDVATNSIPVAPKAPVAPAVENECLSDVAPMQSTGPRRYSF